MSARIPLRALIVEDSADDAELLARELRAAGYDVTYERVDDRSALEAALASGPWEVVFSDDSMPGFDSELALRIVRSREPDVPFIILSGTMGEDVAVEAMHAGASDYIVKGKTRRLAVVLERELLQASGRVARRDLEHAFAALRDVASAVGRLPQPSAVAALAVKRARALLHVDAAILVGWDADAAVLRALAGDGPEELMGATTIRPGDGAAGLAFERREPVYIDGSERRSWEERQPEPVRSALAVPLIVGDRAIGALAVVAGQSRSFTQDQIELLSLLASEVGPTLEAGRLFDQAEREQRAAEALAEAAAIVAAGTVARETIPSIIAALQRVVAAEVAALAVRESDDSFRVLSAVGYPDGIVGKVFPLNNGVMSRALRTGAVQLASDGDVPSAMQVRTGVRLALAVPIVRNEKVIGALGASALPSRDQYTAYEVRLVERFAGLIAMALENERLTAEASARSAELERLAHFDIATQLPNRTLFREHLRDAVVVAERKGGPLAVLLLDLDHFKDTNDAFGHEVGDAVLREIGPRLARALDGIEIARLGGDEFALLVPGAGATEALAMSRRVLEVFERPFSAFGQLLLLRASVGCAVHPRDGADPDALLRCAEVALEAAKRMGIGVAVYSLEQDVYAPSRLALMAQLRQALEEGQLLLHYQPIVDLDGRPRVMEALVRWRHPQRGMVQPGEFVPLAERAGLMKPLTRWVMAEALRQCRIWRDAGRDIAVSVNLSTRTLHDAGLPQMVRDLLRESGCDPSALDLEITESDVMADPKGAIEILARLRALGVRVSIDDFGTGYSSLAYLNRLNVDEVKIDRSFVGTMVVDASSAAIVRATIELGHGLGLEVVAEGVEDEATRDALRGLGCDRAQGFLFARPATPRDLEPLLSRAAAAR